MEIIHTGVCVSCWIYSGLLAKPLSDAFVERDSLLLWTIFCNNNNFLPSMKNLNWGREILSFKSSNNFFSQIRLCCILFPASKICRLNLVSFCWKSQVEMRIDHIVTKGEIKWLTHFFFFQFFFFILVSDYSLHTQVHAGIFFKKMYVTIAFLVWISFCPQLVMIAFLCWKKILVWTKFYF